MFPENAFRVTGVEGFRLSEHRKHIFEEDAIPGYLELNSGSRLRDIDYVVLATGCVTSYPSLE